MYLSRAVSGADSYTNKRFRACQYQSRLHFLAFYHTLAHLKCAPFESAFVSYQIRPPLSTTFYADKDSLLQRRMIVMIFNNKVQACFYRSFQEFAQTVLARDIKSGYTFISKKNKENPVSGKTRLR